MGGAQRKSIMHLKAEGNQIFHGMSSMHSTEPVIGM